MNQIASQIRQALDGVLGTPLDIHRRTVYGIVEADVDYIWRRVERLVAEQDALISHAQILEREVLRLQQRLQQYERGDEENLDISTLRSLTNTSHLMPALEVDEPEDENAN